MKALFIGGTGTISMAITKKLLAEGHEVYLLNRGNRNADLQGNVHFLNVDVNDEKAVLEKIDGLQFDVVAEFIAFVPNAINVENTHVKINSLANLPLYYEYTTDVKTALEREKQIKGWNRQRKNKLVENKNPEWKELYTDIIE